jgi:hypothetical protein
VLDDAVATQDTVTQLIAAVRRVIREVPGAPGVAARAALVDALVTDALNLLGHLVGADNPVTAADLVCCA